MNFIETAITILTLAIFITFASSNQNNQNTGNGVLVGTGGVVETSVNNSIRGNGTDGCAGCTSVNPGN